MPLCCVHELKLTNHMLLLVTTKHSMHSKTCLNFLQCDSKQTQLHCGSSKLDLDPLLSLQRLLNFVMAPGCQHLCADNIYNVVPAPISRFGGTWFSHIMTRHPQNIRPPWATLLNCFTGAKILGYICVCETLKLIQQIQDRRYSLI